MNVTLEDTFEERNSYENFVLEKDILYFRIKDRGLVSFHGKNFNIKRRMTSEQLSSMMSSSDFFKVNTECFVNLKKVRMIQDNRVYFGLQSEDSKSVSITKLRQNQLKGFLKHDQFEHSLDDTLK
jgi:DNA-binding LytR/AlgR family response regulator